MLCPSGCTGCTVFVPSTQCGVSPTPPWCVPSTVAHGAKVVDRQQMLICGATAGIVKVGVTVKFRLNLPDAWFRLSCATGKFDLKSGEGKLRSWYSRRSATG